VLISLLLLAFFGRVLAVASHRLGRKVGGFLPIGRLVDTVGLASVKLIVMVKRGSSTFSAATVARSGLALGRTVGKLWP